MQLSNPATCPSCFRELTVRNSWEVGTRRHARLECDRCDYVVAASIEPPRIVRTWPINRRKKTK